MTCFLLGLLGACIGAVIIVNIAIALRDRRANPAHAIHVVNTTHRRK